MERIGEISLHQYKVLSHISVVIDSRTTAILATAGVAVLAVLIFVWFFLRGKRKESKIYRLFLRVVMLCNIMKKRSDILGFYLT